MAHDKTQPLEIFAPAKINLFLHVTGKNNDGYHSLQSLVAFADFGDTIKINHNNNFSFTTTDQTEYLSTDEDNLIVKAAKALSSHLQMPLDLSITLNKKIPVGAGLGGGSADAAATIKGLLSFWNKSIPEQNLNKILISLGADVPMCYSGTPAITEGIGEIITPLPAFPPLPAILIYPNEFCSTAGIFKEYHQEFSEPVNIPDNFSNQTTAYKFLKELNNDLTSAACQKISIIDAILKTLAQQNGCAISRMSGSGSACFGLFDTEENSKKAADIIQKERPDWWVWPTILG